MPTGYTSDLYNGKDVKFKDFAMSCARNFGALITMRDEAHDAKIPDKFEPSSYHKDALIKASKNRTFTKRMTARQAARGAEQAYQTATAGFIKLKRETDARRERYKNMIAEASVWIPPTDDHVGLRKFMIDQLTESIKYDCREYKQPKRQTPEEWQAQKLKDALWHVEYHTEELKKERERCKERTDWVQQLRASLR